MRCVALALVLALPAIPAASQGLAEAAARARREREAAAAQAWKVFVDPAGAYTVRFPKAPVRRVAQLPDGSGEQTGYFADTGTRAYMVGYHEETAASLARGQAAVLADMRDGFLEGTKGRLLGEKPISLETHHGVELDVQEPGLVWRVRFLLVGPRVFTLTTCARQGDDDREGRERFLASFALKH